MGFNHFESLSYSLLPDELSANAQSNCIYQSLLLKIYLQVQPPDRPVSSQYLENF